jgi:Tol biopolymer transport system component
MFSSFRRIRPLSLVATAVLSFAACSGDDSPLAPEDAAPSPSLTTDEATATVGAQATLITNQRIAFLSARSGTFSVYKMDTEGNNVVRLTKTGNDVFQPEWSYNNARIAVVRSRRDEYGASNADIWLVNADGTNGHWLRPTMSLWPLKDPSWAPDGSHLLVTMYFAPNWYLAKLDVASGNVTLLHPYGGGIIGDHPSYDKAGKRITYVGAGHKTVDQVFADGSGHKVLYKTDTYTVDLPRYSPDGGRIVFQKGQVGVNTDVFVKNLGTGVVTKVTSSTKSDGLATWSPDGTRLAFVSWRSGAAQIYTMSSTGANVTRITHTSTAEGSPVWTH